MRFKATALILALALQPPGMCGQSRRNPVTIHVDAGHSQTTQETALCLQLLILKTDCTPARYDDRSHELILKVVNYAAQSRTAIIDFAGAKASGTAKVTNLASDDLSAENNFAHPQNVAPQAGRVDIKDGKISADLRPYSVTVFRVSML